MKASARNVFSGKVGSITAGAINSEVELITAGGDIHEQREDDRRYTPEQLDAMREGRRAYDISASAKPTIGMMNGLAFGGAADRYAALPIGYFRALLRVELLIGKKRRDLKIEICGRDSNLPAHRIDSAADWAFPFLQRFDLYHFSCFRHLSSERGWIRAAARVQT